ncbi:hypothetical protein B0T20DRAFT_223450 [Sordaria brevicollis]|uniref:Uncharacterized protein n=1 Tax=Sordaria brevicollis TaxID=83679 RepID=A0AAE0PCU0_SORBR|nr:hypothetical protein B0T20DRAFT_223450 [Sordaria brevicollis]
MVNGDGNIFHGLFKRGGSPAPCSFCSPKSHSRQFYLSLPTPSIIDSKLFKMAPKYNRKRPSNKGKGKLTYIRKYGPTAEEDAEVAAFWANPQKEGNNQDAESSYQPADHDTPHAIVENIMPAGAKGLKVLALVRATLRCRGGFRCAQ